jgi:hypothetical protein
VALGGFSQSNGTTVRINVVITPAIRDTTLTWLYSLFFIAEPLSFQPHIAGGGRSAGIATAIAIGR